MNQDQEETIFRTIALILLPFHWMTLSCFVLMNSSASVAGINLKFKRKEGWKYLSCASWYSQNVQSFLSRNTNEANHFLPRVSFQENKIKQVLLCWATVRSSSLRQNRLLRRAYICRVRAPPIFAAHSKVHDPSKYCFHFRTISWIIFRLPDRLQTGPN